MRTKILYLSYTGMNESLGASQVLSYLYKLSEDYEYHLISLEKPEDWSDEKKMTALKRKFHEKGIFWYPIQYKESKIAKLFNWVRFTQKTLSVSRKNQIIYLHCRSYLPAMSARILQQIKPIKYLFDTRGFLFDERIDIGQIKRGSLIYKILKRIEKGLYLHAAGINKLSFEGKRTIQSDELFEGGSKLKNIWVIPTCVDLERFQLIKRNYTSIIKIGYVGNTSGWYDFDKTLQTVRAIGAQCVYHLTIFNGGQHEYILQKLREHQIPKENFTLEQVDFNDIPKRLKEFEIGIFFIRPFFSKRASAATRMGEMLASGIPVLTSGKAGDHKFLIETYGCGKLIEVNDLAKYDYPSIFKQLRSPETEQKCRMVAEKYFSLEKGVEGFKKIYSEVFG